MARQQPLQAEHTRLGPSWLWEGGVASRVSPFMHSRPSYFCLFFDNSSTIAGCCEGWYFKQQVDSRARARVCVCIRGLGSLGTSQASHGDRFCLYALFSEVMNTFPSSAREQSAHHTLHDTYMMRGWKFAYHPVLYEVIPVVSSCLIKEYHSMRRSPYCRLFATEDEVTIVFNGGFSLYCVPLPFSYLGGLIIFIAF